jgi:hypothetical protein
MYYALPKINIYNVKAKYIEEIDLYLVQDIDIPDTTFEERYNIMRNLHPFTKGTKLETITNIDKLTTLIKHDCDQLYIFMQEPGIVKWFPMLSVKN